MFGSKPTLATPVPSPAVAEGDRGVISPAGSMCTVGVDLSASKARTACAAIEWGPGAATVAVPAVDLDDSELLGRLAPADWIGIEAPFGWPLGMAEAVYAYATTGEWSGIDKAAFRYRRTELFIHEFVLAETDEKLWPISVSSDRAALTAWRVAQLRERAFQDWGLRFDRSGADRVLEVHPVATLLLWGLDRLGYKGVNKGEPDEASVLARETLLAAIEAQAPWLAWEAGARDACVQCADALDAVLAALIARAGALGLTVAPEEGDLALAGTEGWIHLPPKGSLPDLCSTGAVADASSSRLAPA